MQLSASDDQTDVLTFLEDPSSYPWPVTKIERLETHGAIVFLAGDQVLKIKRAVRLPYLDFSTLEQRRKVCLNEIAVNKTNAPQIYIDAIPITRNTTGGLAIGGDGEPVEWAVHMRRFDEGAVLHSIACCGEISDALACQLGDAVANYHRKAPVSKNADSVEYLRKVIDQLTQAFDAHQNVFSVQEVIDFRRNSNLRLSRTEHSLQMRSEHGLVRRCHGDLHLNNIVLIDSKPVLFDAIEFDDSLATIDVMYDLSFLLMDLLQRKLNRAANLVLNRYLFRARSAVQIYGLEPLPLFLACRAGIRAMVAADKMDLAQTADEAACIKTATSYFKSALTYLTPPPPRLIVIGGFSGTGKSTLGANIAPFVRAEPGAFHLRSDLERKAIAGVEETEQLEPKFYSPEFNATVYATLVQKASIALRCGHSVIVDAVYSRPEERVEIETLASDLGVAFTGLWLSAPKGILVERIGLRHGDASDATPEVVERQVERGTGPISWHLIDASGSPEDTLNAVFSYLGISG